MAKIKRDDMSSKSKEALAILEPKQAVLQAEVDKLHSDLDAVLNKMQPMKQEEANIRSEIIKRSSELACIKNSVSTVFAVDSFKDKKVAEAALDALLANKG